MACALRGLWGFVYLAGARSSAIEEGQCGRVCYFFVEKACRISLLACFSAELMLRQLVGSIGRRTRE